MDKLIIERLELEVNRLRELIFVQQQIFKVVHDKLSEYESACSQPSIIEKHDPGKNNQ